MSRIDELRAEYDGLCHAMQTGVVIDQHCNPETPKSTRVGINVALVDHGSLVKLLVDKGLITEEEYFEAMVKGMRREVDRYTAIVAKFVGGNDTTIALG